MSAPRMGVLHGEHVLLGARFEGGSEVETLLVTSYENEVAPAEGLEGALLADLTGCAYLLLSGTSVEALGRAMLAGRELSVGEAYFEAVLTGDGSVCSVPLALRTGDTELVLLDPTARGTALAGWARFLVGVSQGDGAPFAGAEVEDASGMLVPLLLTGAAAEAVLADYVSSPADLPASGRVSSLHLDAIPAVVAHLPRTGSTAPAYLVLVPPANARALWRSLLSFREVSPVGSEAVRALVEGLPWGSQLSGKGPVRVPAEVLAGWGLLRAGEGYVGARGLAGRG